MKCRILLFVAIGALAVLFLPTLAAARAPQEASGKSSGNIPSFSDKPGDLKKLLQNMIRLTKDNKEDELQPYLDSLVMPDPDAWFQEVFGYEFGSYFAKQYQRISRNIAAQLENEFKSLLNQKQTSLDIFRFDKTCDQYANDAEYPILRVRKKQQVLYEARFSNTQVYNLMWFFAYINGGFRYVGQLQMPVRRTMIAVRGDASDMPREGLRLIHQVPPAYPLDAQTQRETDLVRLQLFINPDGTVKDLYVIHGRCNFSESLIQAARQWRFDVPDYMKSGEIPWVYEFSFGGAR